MAPKLYWIIGSPPARAVLMTAKTIGLDLEFENVDLQKDEHLAPEFVKLNPQHTVPVLVEENGFTLWDSHAIMTYLVSKYSKDDSLYPKDLEKRALIDQRLHFESGVLWAKSLLVMRPIIYFGGKTINEFGKKGVVEAYGFLEAFLEGKQWMAGDTVTIADYSIFASATAISIDVFIPIDPQEFPRLTAWVKRFKDLPVYEVNRKGQEAFEHLMESFLK